MDVDLPPAIVVRRLLRQQRHRRAHFVRSIQAIYDRDWATQGGQGYDRRGRIRLLATAYDQQLVDAGAFEVARLGSAERLKLKAETAFSIQGNVLWPITFGRNTTSTDPAFTEQSLMVVRVGGNFSHKKASIFEAPLCIFWTRHAMERLCQRAPIGNDLGGELVRSALPIAKALSVAITFKFTRPSETVDRTGSTVWLPYRHGLLIVTERATFSYKNSAQFGWRFNFIKNELTNNYVRRAKVSPILVRSKVDELSEDYEEAVAPDLLSVASWGVATFVGESQLSSQQTSYRDRFDRVMGAFNGEVADKLFKLNFDPEFALDGIHIDDKNFTKSLMEEIDTIRNVIGSDSFQVQTGSQLNHVLESDMSSSQYRNFLSLRR